MIFASTGTKKPDDPPWKYVEAFAGSDIETNPPATNDAVEKSGRTFTRTGRPTAAAGRCWPRSTGKVDMQQLEETLMDEGIKKFADPQKALGADRRETGRTCARRALEGPRCICRERRGTCASGSVPFRVRRWSKTFGAPTAKSPFPTAARASGCPAFLAHLAGSTAASPDYSPVLGFERTMRFGSPTRKRESFRLPRLRVGLPRDGE